MNKQTKYTVLAIGVITTLFAIFGYFYWERKLIDLSGGLIIGLGLIYVSLSSKNIDRNGN